MQLRVREVSKLLKVSEKAIHGWIKRGILRASLINDQYRLNRADVLECITSQNRDVPPGMIAVPNGNRATASLATALQAGGIFYAISGTDKPSVIRDLVSRLPLPKQSDREVYLRLLLAREALGSTGIGDGIAIPHVRRPAVLQVADPLVTLCFLEKPIDFHAFDGKFVDTLFSLISPTVQMHLDLLSRLSFVLADSKLRATIKRQAPPEEILTEVRRVEDTLVEIQQSGQGENA